MGFIRSAGSITLSGRGRMGIAMNTENPAVARRYKTLIADVFGVSARLMVGESGFNRNRRVYRLAIKPDQDAEGMLTKVGILRNDGAMKGINEAFDETVIRGKCCRKACLRGVFLGAGAISAPDKGYHLEIVLESEALANSVKRLLNSFAGVHAKVVKRRDSYVAYIKDSERIADVLGMIGAHAQLFKYEDVRVMKEVRNRTNRINNCDSANMDRALKAADKQMGAIRAIEGSVGLDALPGGLLDTALARMDHPEATLAELGEFFSPPLKKSAVALRLRKIEEFARGIGEKGN